MSGCVVPGGYSPLAKKPALNSTIQKTNLVVGGINRSLHYYLPEDLPANAPLVIVLHGSLQTAGMMRRSTGYQFERLADEHGFVVVYPNGYGRHWNDCRKKASYSARKNGVDDTQFVLALIEHFHETHRVDRGRVFAAGYSNGGHMAYRLALETPEHITAIAAIAANLPADENCDCRKSNRPIPVMIMNGTLDPINPYRGGTVSIFGFGNRGKVLSAHESAEYFAGVNGFVTDPETNSLPAANGAKPSSIELTSWLDAENPEVTLVTIEGGGHVVPQPVYASSILMGSTSHHINGPEVIWEFFARQPTLTNALGKPSSQQANPSAEINER